jgi:2'-5' RNA ligase
MRLFVAIELADTARLETLKVVEELSAVHNKQRFVSPDNLHFTLKFIGEVPEERVAAVEDAVAESVKGVKPFRVRTHGLGYFGSRRSARVVWIGTNKGREEIIQIARKLDSGLSSFRKDEREPSPHITICRPSGDTSKLIEDVEKMKSRELGEMVVTAIKLKKSTLMPKGAVYEDVKEFNL